MKPIRHLLALLALLLAGCSTHSPSQYISPRVEGRVLDSQTRRPLAEVTVRRFEPNQDSSAYASTHGGEVMVRTPFVRSRVDGSFVLESERELALLRRLGWYSVSLAYEHRGYERFTATYTVAKATNSVKGEPVVFTGDILLKPLAK